MPKEKITSENTKPKRKTSATAKKTTVRKSKVVTENTDETTEKVSVDGYEFAREEDDRVVNHSLEMPEIEIVTPEPRFPVIKMRRHDEDDDFYENYVPRKHSKKKRSPRFALVGLMGLLFVNFAVALGVDYLSTSKSPAKSASATGSVSSNKASVLDTAAHSTVQAILGTIQPDGTYLYTNEALGFTLLYPAQWAKVEARDILSATEAEAAKPIARIAFVVPAQDAQSAEMEVMRIRIDSVDSYVQVVEKTKANLSQAPTYIGKVGVSVVSLESKMPAPLNSSTESPAQINGESVRPAAPVPITPASIYTNSIRSVVESFKVLKPQPTPAVSSSTEASGATASQKVLHK